MQLPPIEAFAPFLSARLGPSPQSLQSQLGNGGYASADAARAGGGLYQLLLQAACTLATDPAPKVATLGLAALRAADVELTLVPTAGPGDLAVTIAVLQHAGLTVYQAVCTLNQVMFLQHICDPIRDNQQPLWLCVPCPQILLPRWSSWALLLSHLLTASSCQCPLRDQVVLT